MLESVSASFPFLSLFTSHHTNQRAKRSLSLAVELHSTPLWPPQPPSPSSLSAPSPSHLAIVHPSGFTPESPSSTLSCFFPPSHLYFAYVHRLNTVWLYAFTFSQIPRHFHFLLRRSGGGGGRTGCPPPPPPPSTFSPSRPHRILPWPGFCLHLFQAATSFFSLSFLLRSSHNFRADSLHLKSHLPWPIQFVKCGRLSKSVVSEN